MAWLWGDEGAHQLAVACADGGHILRSGCRIQDWGFRVWGLGFGIKDPTRTLLPFRV